MENKNIKISIMIPESLYIDVKTLARQQDRSMASLIRNALEAQLATEKMKELMMNGDIQRLIDEMHMLASSNPHTITKITEKGKKSLKSERGE